MELGKGIPKYMSMNSPDSNQGNRGVLTVGKKGIPTCCILHSAVRNKIKCIYNNRMGSRIYSRVRHLLCGCSYKAAVFIAQCCFVFWLKLKPYLSTCMKEKRGFK